jgi:hypothetical protein
MPAARSSGATSLGVDQKPPRHPQLAPVGLILVQKATFDVGVRVYPWDPDQQNLGQNPWSIPRFHQSPPDRTMQRSTPVAQATTANRTTVKFRQQQKSCACAE